MSTRTRSNDINILPKNEIFRSGNEYNKILLYTFK
jgi:hypothetical protein